VAPAQKSTETCPSHVPGKCVRWDKSVRWGGFTLPQSGTLFPMTQGTQVYTVEQVAKHHTRSDLWIIIHGKVYDLSSFLDIHPGGDQILLQYAGKSLSRGQCPWYIYSLVYP